MECGIMNCNTALTPAPCPVSRYFDSSTSTPLLLQLLYFHANRQVDMRPIHHFGVQPRSWSVHWGDESQKFIQGEDVS